MNITNKLDIVDIRFIGKMTIAFWFSEEILGSLSASYELTMRSGNRFVLDLDDDGDTLVLSKLFVKNKGAGLGTLIMECLKDHAYREHKLFLVTQVINPSFFRKFDWLDEDFTIDCRSY